MNLRTSLVLLLASGCVSEQALEKAQAAFAEAFTPTKSVDLDGGSRCAPVDDLALEGTVHPGYEGSSLTADIAWGEEQATSEKVKVGAGGSWSIPVDPSRLECTNAVGRCTLQVAVTIVSEEEGDSYKGTSTFDIAIEDDRFEMFPDADGDGYGADGVAAELVCDDNGYADRQGDCDDALDSVHEGVAMDTCNGVDDDCDDDIDEDGVFSNYYPDLDGDGFGAEGGTAELRCDVPDASEMLAPNDADCVDDPSVDPYAAAIHPEADEMCDGFDNDCDGGIDDNDPDGPDDGLSYFLDKDGDGAFHNVEEFRCNVPGVQGVDYVLSAPAPGDVDCDDTDAALNRKDLDLDTFDTCGGDCDDGTFGVNPDADELLGNNFDEDCDGYIGCYADVDNDGHGALTDTDFYALPVPLSCDDAGNDYASIADDCLDEASADGANAFPGNPAGDDPSDGLDNDCSGVLACYIDFDRDDYGGMNVDEVMVAATNGRGDCDAVDGLATTNTDCRDDDGSINPGAAEIVADGTDQDCDGNDDCYRDDDQDGYGSATAPVVIAAVPAAPGACDDAGLRLADNNTDCDDADNQTYPTAPEGLLDPDYDCNGLVSCYEDLDGDGFGSAVTTNATTDPGGDSTCDTAPDASDVDGDCDDSLTTGDDFYPSAPETLGDPDYDCNSSVICTLDDDEDGFGNDDGLTFTSLVTSPGDSSNCGSTYKTADNTDDCDDIDPNLNPSATELADNNVDENCDERQLCYADADVDGFFGDQDSLTPVGTTCTSPGWAIFAGTDCDDTSARASDVFPGSTLGACDGLDNDCDPDLVDEFVLHTGSTTAVYPGLNPEDQLSAALASTDLSDGDTLQLCAPIDPPFDHYLGSFTIDKPIIVDGNGAVLDGGYTNPLVSTCTTGDTSVMSVDGSSWTGSDQLELYDITLTGGCQEATAPSDHGGGLEIIDADVYAERMNISGNAAPFGGGVALRGMSYLEWFDGELFGNRATSGGGAWVDTSSVLVMNGVDDLTPLHIELNRASNGGGLYVAGTATLTFTDVISNTATSNGAGLYVTGPTDITDGRFEGNNATGAGISAYVVGFDPASYPTYVFYEFTFQNVTNNDGSQNVKPAFAPLTTTDGNDTCTENGCFCDSGSC